MNQPLSAIAALLAVIALPLAAQSGTQPDQVPVPAKATVPVWPKPQALQLPAGAPSIRSKDLELVHSPDVLGGFAIRVGGKAMAIGQNRPMIGYAVEGELKWLDLAQAANRTTTVQTERRSLVAVFECTDPDKGRWTIRQTFRPGSIPGTIDIETECKVDQDRAVAFLPMLMIFPGASSFGEGKGQGLMAGLEYLENEPSSSEADVIGPASKRQVPDSLKLTIPLMAIQNEGCYLALTWQMRPYFSAVFDSPDRLFSSGGHVMGLLFPGSNGKNRQEGSLLPRACETVRGGALIVLRTTLFGGKGESVVPAVQQYASLHPLPSLPTGHTDLAQYVSLASAGWLDSKIREGSRIRHAILGGNFPPGQAADAAMWMEWLASQTSDQALASRLLETSHSVLEGIPPAALNVAAVGHVRSPAVSLVYGHVAENVSQAATMGRSLLDHFEPDGSLKYHAVAGGPDYAKTHFSKEANGLTSRSVLDLLEAAAFSGNRELLADGLKRLQAMDKFRNGVPRGAQTWECPLHTPDVLASAQMVRAYTLGYELTGNPDFLEQARYWAWTGVPFVYLVNPTEGPVGLYATIAVFGATQWKAPVWMGLPVQWCGLVYADALYRLVRHDPKGPWKKVADGITLSGIEQSWPVGNPEAQGLLPDSFVLRDQRRNGPAINPATVQACALRYFGQTPVYDFWCFRKNHLLVHAPGEIRNTQEKGSQVIFDVLPAFKTPCFILINGLAREPQLRINSHPTPCTAPHQFLEKEGCLILKTEGLSRIELQRLP